MLAMAVHWNCASESDMHATSELITTIRAQFALDWYGIHGIQHWERVRKNGLHLARSAAANSTVVELFAYPQQPST
jgi:HD superfamily phosphodiesterase